MKPDISANIRAELARRQVRQVDLAGPLGLTQQSVSRKLRGEAPWSADEVVVVAQTIGCDVALLMQPTAANDEAVPA